MSDLSAELAYFTTVLSNETKLSREKIRDAVEQGPFGNLDQEKRDRLVRQLESSFDVTQEIGSTVLSDYRPWLRDRRSEIDFYYWDRLRRYYLEKRILPPQVVATLDRVTDEVLDYCGNPAEEGAWKRRGMVMGHVQSGKTTNYSSLICKAADAGYKIIILLAGITNSLRAQTQERLDDTFIGRKSIFQGLGTQELTIVHFSQGTRRFPAYGTSRYGDFNKEAALRYGVSLSALKEPIIFVTKKNKLILETLRDWLREQNQGRQIQDPLILIDDEADNASINTASDPDRVTAINRVIRETLTLFGRSSYVGYTATPFANIFIDPDTDHDMLQDDLFPRHFIKALDPPSNYVGARRIFSETGDLQESMIRIVDDYADLLPLKHKKEVRPPSLPPSLYQAIRVFILTRAIRILDDDGNKHCSMMVNVSRFNDVQEHVYGLIYEYFQQLKNSVIVHAGLGDRAFDNDNISEIASDFEIEFAGTGHSFSEILKVLEEVVSTLEIRTINMRGGTLDYSQHSDKGLHVIAIGGLALSRGLTLEGLTVSYILRNASASDTLMQMARWFGYRPGYEQICRLYLPERSFDHYEFITDAIEELRSEINRMEQLRMTPEQFGLRVRHSPAAIRITAANKMRSATTITVAQDYSGQHVEGFALYNDHAVNLNHLRKTRNFLSTLPPPTAEEGGFFWREVRGRDVYEFVTGFRFPERHAHLGQIDGRTSLFLDYVLDRLEADLREWDVVVPTIKSAGENMALLEGLEIPLRSRRRGVVENNVYRITQKNKAANPDDEKLGLSDEEIERARGLNGSRNVPLSRAYCLQRSRPLLIIHMFNAMASGGLTIKGPVVTLSFCLPDTSVRPEERHYQVNAVYRRQMEELAAEPDDDDRVLEEAGYG